MKFVGSIIWSGWSSSIGCRIFERRSEHAKEFKEFALKGNVLDLAIGIIIGGAFGKIVSSFVGDILMPPFGLLLGKVAFTYLFLDLSGQPHTSLKAAKDVGAATLNYGLFLNTIIDFLIVAFVIFLIVRQVNWLNGPTEHGLYGEARKRLITHS